MSRYTGLYMRYGFGVGAPYPAVDGGFLDLRFQWASHCHDIIRPWPTLYSLLFATTPLTAASQQRWVRPIQCRRVLSTSTSALPIMDPYNAASDLRHYCAACWRQADRAQRASPVFTLAGTLATGRARREPTFSLFYFSKDNWKRTPVQPAAVSRNSRVLTVEKKGHAQSGKPESVVICNIAMHACI